MAKLAQGGKLPTKLKGAGGPAAGYGSDSPQVTRAPGKRDVPTQLARKGGMIKRR